MYAQLQEMASTQKLQQLMQYVGRNWITGNTVLLERVHEVRPNQQRHRGLASWTESARVWKVPASSVPPDPPSSPRGPSEIPSDQACVKEEVTAHPDL